MILFILKFSNRGGSDLDIIINMGYEIQESKEVGLRIGYSEIKREKASKNGVVVPSDTIKSTFMGVYLAF